MSTQFGGIRQISWRRSRGGVTVAAVAVCMILSLEPRALAHGPVTDPPGQSTAAPATSTQAAVGDGQNYWASDTCHYYQQGGQWWSDMCLRAIPDGSGNLIKGQYGYFPNLGNGQYGKELVRLDFNTPNYLTLGVIDQQSYTITRWVRSPFSDPNRQETLGKTQDGQPVWVSVTPPTMVPLGGNSVSGGQSGTSSAGMQQYWDLMKQQAQTQKEMTDRTLAPACNSSLNGCR